MGHTGAIYVVHRPDRGAREVSAVVQAQVLILDSRLATGRVGVRKAFAFRCREVCRHIHFAVRAGERGVVLDFLSRGFVSTRINFLESVYRSKNESKRTGKWIKLNAWCTSYLG